MSEHGNASVHFFRTGEQPPAAPEDSAGDSATGAAAPAGGIDWGDDGGIDWGDSAPADNGGGIDWGEPAPATNTCVEKKRKNREQ